MSGIYIPDVSLPGEEDLWIVVRKDGSFTYNVREGEGWQDGKQKAVPVPPHGRLGDLDALLESKDILDDIGWPDAYLPYSTIEAAPTIIPAELASEEAPDV